MVLGGEDITTRPCQLGSEEFEGLDKDSGLDGYVNSQMKSNNIKEELRTHVKASSNTSALQWLLFGVFGPSSHQTRHLILSQLDLAAAKGCQADIGDLELVCWSRHDGGWEEWKWSMSKLGSGRE